VYYFDTAAAQEDYGTYPLTYEGEDFTVTADAYNMSGIMEDASVRVIEKDEVYDTAYEYAGFNSTTIKLMEDGVHVYFAPYSLGPYATGFIDVVLSYKDFLGRDQL
jgi:hypothetical protein